MMPRDVRIEYRAGRLDGHRSPHARPWHGWRYGDTAYGLGYALAILAARVRR